MNDLSTTQWILLAVALVLLLGIIALVVGAQRRRRAAELEAEHRANVERAQALRERSQSAQTEAAARAAEAEKTRIAADEARARAEELEWRAAQETEAAESTRAAALADLEEADALDPDGAAPHVEGDLLGFDAPGTVTAQDWARDADREPQPITSGEFSQQAEAVPLSGPAEPIRNGEFIVREEAPEERSAAPIRGGEFVTHEPDGRAREPEPIRSGDFEPSGEPERSVAQASPIEEGEFERTGASRVEAAPAAGGSSRLDPVAAVAPESGRDSLGPSASVDVFGSRYEHGEPMGLQAVDAERVEPVRAERIEQAERIERVEPVQVEQVERVEQVVVEDERRGFADLPADDQTRAIPARAVQADQPRAASRPQGASVPGQGASRGWTDPSGLPVDPYSDWRAGRR